MTLALLLTAVTGAWAQDTYTITFSANGNTKTVENVTLPKTFSCSYNDANDELDLILKELYGWTGTSGVTYCDNHSSLVSSDASNVTAGVNGNNQYITINGPFAGSVTVTGTYHVVNKNTDYSLEITFPGVAEEIEVTPGEAANTWTFEMPAFDVELTPIYAPTAVFATDGNLVLTPTAIEGIYAESTDAIVKAGTVAKIGETENPQGIVMYAVTSANQATAPELSAFSADVPTAKDITDAGDVLVWYYIKGADTPQGQTATAENTFNDSEICATPIKVTVLSNKFDITFKAANDNTIESGKATVTVGGTAATVTEGKLEGVKMGSEVKLKANTGYKFRKVEVKKKEAETLPALNITNPSVGQLIGNDGKNYNYGAVPTGVTAVAKICYVDGDGHGLALALANEGMMDWSTAMTTCAAHTPAFTGGTWKLATKDEWDNMISAAGSYTALRDGFSSVGGTNMQSVYFWSSTEEDSDYARDYNFSSGRWGYGSKGNGERVRACLAF